MQRPLAVTRCLVARAIKSYGVQSSCTDSCTVTCNDQVSTINFKRQSGNSEFPARSTEQIERYCLLESSMPATPWLIDSSVSLLYSYGYFLPGRYKAPQIRRGTPHVEVRNLGSLTSPCHKSQTVAFPRALPCTLTLKPVSLSPFPYCEDDRIQIVVGDVERYR